MIDFKTFITEDKGSTFLTKLLAQHDKTEQIGMIDTFYSQNGEDGMDLVRAAAKRKGAAMYKKVDKILVDWDYS